jgi:hypothetical protein
MPVIERQQYRRDLNLKVRHPAPTDTSSPVPTSRVPDDTADGHVQNLAADPTGKATESTDVG